jgi:hypothetical protein
MITPVLEQAPTGVRPAPYAPAILAAALVLRVLVTVMALLRVPPSTQVHAHSEILGIAGSLAAGHGFASPFFADSGPTAFLSPGYPLFVAGVFRLFGLGSLALVVVVVLQILFSTLTVWLAMRLAERHFGAWTAIVAGCLCGFSLSLALMSFWVWETCLSSLLLLSLFTAMPKLRSKGQWAAAGAGTAAATLVNPALFPTLVVLAIWQARRCRMIPWIGILAFLLVYAPWPARNLGVMHAFIPFRSNFGYELWMGNHPGGDGNFHHRLDPEENAEERAQFVSLGEMGYMRMKADISRDYIRTHRAEFLRLTGRRIVRFWVADDQGMNLTGAAFSLLAFAGLALAWRFRSSLRVYAIPLVIYPLPYYVTHADGRFRHMIDPLLAILAAYAIVVPVRTIAGRLKSQRQKAQTASLVA